MIGQAQRERLGQELFESINGNGWLMLSPMEQRRWRNAAFNIYLQGVNQNIAQGVAYSTN